MNLVEKKFEKFLQKSSLELQEACPGFHVQAYHHGRLKVDLTWGTCYPYYDLASLTKIIFTATLLMKAVDQGVLNPHDQVSKWWAEVSYQKTSLFNLMTHSAGMPWWKPFFRTLKGPLKPQARWEQLVEQLKKMTLKKNRKAVYSDVDLLILGQILCEATGQTLTQMWQELQSTGVMGEMHFNLQNRPLFKRESYAPTELCSWRQRLLQGEVHDENAWALGGLAPHAGLFGRAQDVSRWALALRNSLYGQKFRGVPDLGVSARTVHHFTRRQLPLSQGDWGWLFMKPTYGSASCGRFFSRTSFGHTGFTGTSLWMDPRQDLIVVLLSNRLYPHRDRRSFIGLRPRIHSWLVASLEL